MLRNIRKALKSKRGSSLLECVISLALFAVITTMAAAMLGMASTITSRTTDTDNAVNAAGDEAENFSDTTGGQEVQLTFSEAGVSIAAKIIEIEATVKNSTVSIWKIQPLPKPPSPKVP